MIEDFTKRRESQNKRILESRNLDIKRFFGIDSAVYRDGALDSRTKELMALTASVVLRCDDCITYHLTQCRKLDVSSEQFHEAMAVSLVVGGSVTMPHVRRAFETWEELGGQ